MSDLEAYRRKWTEKIERRQREHEEEQAAAARDLLTPADGEPAVPASPAPQIRKAELSISQRVSMAGDQGLNAMDQVFINAFRLTDFFPRHGLTYATFYTETLEEFFEPLIAYEDLSAASRAEWVAAMAAGAREKAEASDGRSGIFGVNLPDKGCYLNGWLFAYGAGLSPRAALEVPAVYARVLGTAAHEKLGHGFVTAFSALGEERRRLYLWRFDLARKFGRQPADNPRAVLLRDKAALIHTSSQFTEEGWATWIERYFVEQLDDVGSGQGYTLGRLLMALDAAGASVGEEAAGVRQALGTLLGDEPANVSEVHAAALALQAAGEEVNDLVARGLGQPLPYVAGYLLLRRLEERLGAFCLPYAVLIAANLEYNLEEISAPELAHVIRSEPRMNVDSRLAQLGLLRLDRPGDLAALARAARDELNLTVPAPLIGDQ